MKSNVFLEYLLGDVFEETLHVTVRAMMGGHVLYSEGKVFGIAEDDELWLKGSDEFAGWYLSRGSRKFSYPKEGKVQEMNFFLVPEEVLENRGDFNEWLDVALSVAKLPKKRR
jgi:DNA transformation protein